ncbi:type II toxin-antitoxin system RelE/ParE family toxin [Nocardia sp. NPDC050175]|uniref:type II toxin-antitoxin system RelE/ParE family toxin n=1 Tax=Nocardia sp. NPDC050175 TaxID=3364317 RepID=UPI0037A89B9B
MRKGESFPGCQAEIEFSDAFVEYLEDLPPAECESVLVDLLALRGNPAGSHPLSNRGSGDRLAGWNTLGVLGKQHRVIFSSRIVDDVGIIEVLCAGPRRADAAYDMANALIHSGRLTLDEATELWQALVLLDVLAEDIGLDGWDYRPEPAPAGLIRTVVAAGLLDETIARVMSKDEINAAMSQGWGADGPDPEAALRAALARARAGVDAGDLNRIVTDRGEPRCGVALPRAGATCIRRKDHPGPHRATP